MLLFFQTNKNIIIDYNQLLFDKFFSKFYWIVIHLKQTWIVFQTINIFDKFNIIINRFKIAKKTFCNASEIWLTSFSQSIWLLEIFTSRKKFWYLDGISDKTRTMIRS